MLESSARCALCKQFYVHKLKKVFSSEHYDKLLLEATLTPVDHAPITMECEAPILHTYSLCGVKCWPPKGANLSWTDSWETKPVELSLRVKYHSTVDVTLRMCPIGQRKMGVGMCTAYVPKAGPLHMDAVVQSVQYHNILGVDHFYYYEHTSKHKEQFKQFSSDLVTRRQWAMHTEYPVEGLPNRTSIFSFVKHYKGSKVPVLTECYDQQLASTHCFYNSEYEWMISVDLDEYIWLSDHNVSLLDYLEKESGSFTCMTFDRIDILRGSTPVQGLGNELVVEQNELQCPTPEYPKVACRAEDVRVMQIHWAATGSYRFLTHKTAPNAKSLHFIEQYLTKNLDHKGCYINTKYARYIAPLVRKALAENELGQIWRANTTTNL